MGQTKKVSSNVCMQYVHVYPVHGYLMCHITGNYWKF